MTKKIFFIRKNKAKKWNEHEDNLLLDLVNTKLGKKWRFIALHFRNKTKFECYTRFIKINPAVKKGKWSADEDSKIIELVKEIGYDWAKIGNAIKTRTSKQIRSRFIYYLDEGLNNSEFTKEEDEMIKKLLPIFKTNWAKYLNYLPNRSAKIIQNRYGPYKKKSFKEKEENSI